VTSENELIIRPSQLTEHFGPLVSIYVADAAGRLLVEWLKDDWGMFSHPRMDVVRASDLLSEILEDRGITKAKFVPSSRYASDGLHRWERLRDELMYANRYFPQANLDEERLTHYSDSSGQMSHRTFGIAPDYRPEITSIRSRKWELRPSEIRRTDEPTPQGFRICI
jgi:hypothetical protein